MSRPPKRMRSLFAVLALMAATGATAAGAHAAPPGTALLLADTDRDGRVTGADALGRGSWTPGRGAIVLPNIDDDGPACAAVAPDGGRLSDDALAACTDAADARVDGPADVLDLAPLRIPARSVGARATGTLTVDAGAARLFLRGDDGAYTPLGEGAVLDARRLRAGAELVLEARDLVRDPERWDGYIDVTLRIGDRGRTWRDTVRVRVAPLLLDHDLLPIDRLVVGDNGTTTESAERDGYDPDVPAAPVEPGEAEFRADLSAGLAAAGLDERLLEYPSGGDRWLRDQFITGHASMPRAGGVPHGMTVLLRAPGMPPGESSAEFPLRDGGRPLFSVLRGPDVAAVQEYDPARIGDDEHNAVWGSFSSTGNVLVAPPDGPWPSGRVLYGSDGGDAAPDAEFLRLLEAQGVQEPLAVDTGWLAVGHIDEFLSFVPAGTPRGWAVLVADPRLGERLLRELADDGRGGEPLSPGHGDMTVTEALALPELRSGGEIAADAIDAALGEVTGALGLAEGEVVRVPALFTEFAVEGYPRQGIVANHLPAIVNGVETGTGVFLAARPHGPVDGQGRDVFAAYAERALTELGGRIAWVEEWDYGHAVGTVGGEVHCLTNALRDASGESGWWSEG